MLASGIHPKVASERLGHSKVGITLNLYSHVMPGMQEDCGAGGQCFADSPAKARAETHSVAKRDSGRPECRLTI
jgi:hypothetical protein